MHKADHNPDRTVDLPAEADTLALGAALAGGLEHGMVIFLRGDLGTGKTTLARGMLQALGYTGRVKSPTFTLVEVYKFSRLYFYHFDFYRFENSRELSDAGFRDAFDREAVCLVEWPEKAGPSLPTADLTVSLTVAGSGRRADIVATTEAGRTCSRHIPP